MKCMRILLLVAFVAALVGLAIPAAQAAPTPINTVSANVTAKEISCVVDTSTVTFGLMDMSSNKTSGAITVTNNGNVTERFLIRSSAASNGVTGSWAINATAPGADQFAMQFATLGSYLSGTNQEFYTGVTASSSISDAIKLYTPTSTTELGQYSWTVTITAME
jgi:hypothetical protein